MTSDELLLIVYPDQNGNASYTIFDKERRVKIMAHLADDSLKVQILPKPIRLDIEVPKGVQVSSIFVNGAQI